MNKGLEADLTQYLSTECFSLPSASLPDQSCACLHVGCGGAFTTPWRRGMRAIRQCRHLSEARWAHCNGLQRLAACCCMDPGHFSQGKKKKAGSFPSAMYPCSSMFSSAHGKRVCPNLQHSQRYRAASSCTLSARSFSMHRARIMACNSGLPKLDGTLSVCEKSSAYIPACSCRLTMCCRVSAPATGCCAGACQWDARRA